MMSRFFSWLRFALMDIGAALILIGLVFSFACAIYYMMDAFRNYKPDDPSLVRIISWWGYVDNRKMLSDLEYQCNAKIELTEYLYLDDFLALAGTKNAPYDIYIYPAGYENDIVKKVSKVKLGPDISYLSEGYHPDIRERYRNASLTQDTLFFQHAISVIIRNRKLVQSTGFETVKDILDLTQKGRVVLQKNMKQIDWLLRQGVSNEVVSHWDRLYQLVASRRIVLSDFVKNYVKSDLIFGYLDSGEAYNPNVSWSDLGAKREDLIFEVNPRYSHVSSDLVSVKSDKDSALCVGRIIAGKDFLDWVTQTSYYFSPYGDVPRDSEGNPTSLAAAQFVNYAKRLQWTTTSTPKRLQDYNEHVIATWSKIMSCLRRPDTDCPLPES